MNRGLVKRKSNLRDVAARAGVSVATVSRVLNAPDKVAFATRSRVEEAISALKFVPSAAARAINRGRSGIVAALLPTLDNAIYARVVNGLESRLAAEQLSLVVAQTGDDPEIELARAQQMVDIGAEALIVVGITHDDGLYDLMDRAQIPDVAISYFNEHSQLPTIGYDNWEAATVAARHLAGLGHRTVAVLHGPAGTNDRVRQRMAALSAGVNGVEFVCREVPMSTAGGYRGIEDVLEGARAPTAILCFSDVIAQGALSRLQSLGIRVPEEISIMGMEDLPGSRFSFPTLTSVRLSVEEMGERAAEAIACWLSSDIRPDSVNLPLELMIRDSTATAHRK